MTITTRRAVLASFAATGITGGLSTLAWAQAQSRTTTFNNPFIIPNPKLGFVNLAGSAGKDLVEKDRAALRNVFGSNIEVAERALPRCNVLFLYCALDASARVAGASFSFRDVIKGTGAHIAVLASDLDPGLLKNPDFTKNLTAKHDWPANVVITLNRNGEHFGRFFRELFRQMLAGISMPMAWVELAPQGPQQPKDIPGTIALMEAGHIAFGQKKS
jgi:hypothetical protein